MWIHIWWLTKRLRHLHKVTIVFHNINRTGFEQFHHECISNKFVVLLILMLLIFRYCYSSNYIQPVRIIIMQITETASQCACYLLLQISKMVSFWLLCADRRLNRNDVDLRCSFGEWTSVPRSRGRASTKDSTQRRTQTIRWRGN